MNSFASVLGLVGTLLGLVKAIPQLIRLRRAQAAYGVSIDTAATSAIVSCGWAIYGILTNQIFVCLASGSTSLIFGLITFFALRFGRSVKEFKIAPIWLVVLLVAGLVGGQDGLGLMFPISVLAANVPQLWIAYREGNLIDLSLGTWALSVTDGLIWGLYSLMLHDNAILGYGFFQFVTSGLIVVLKLMHLAREKDLESGVGS